VQQIFRGVSKGTVMLPNLYCVSIGRYNRFCCAGGRVWSAVTDRRINRAVIITVHLLRLCRQMRAGWTS